jgi:hypothetical protein
MNKFFIMPFQPIIKVVSHTEHDPMVIEIMKLSALADVQKRFESGESW